MGKLDNLQPEKVFYYFEKICQIPHGSRNTKEISDYCVDFAKEHNLKYYQDDSNNVIIYKPASKGYENHKTVIIQGHLDMVCEKSSDSDHNFETDSLDLIVDGDFIKANNTTLGGDDGIAVAYALAILDDDSLIHPPLEVCLTVDEEIGMLGATALDMSQLSGKYLLNIDSEEEGVFLTSCAGGVSAIVKLLYSRHDIEDVTGVILTISGLLGGHSGTEIHRGLANAHKLLGRLLYTFNSTIRYGIDYITGGTKDNAIAHHVEAGLFIENEDYNELVEICKEIESEFNNEYDGIENHISISIKKTDKTSGTIIDSNSKEKLTFILMQSPNGVIAMNPYIDNLVQTSLNCGILATKEHTIEIGYSIRSSIESAKWAIYEQLEYLSSMMGCQCTFEGNYPGWKYKEDSYLRNVMTEVFMEQYHKEPKINAIHAGLECGLFSSNIKDLDIVSYGPDIFDIHTYKERLSISSVQRVYNMTLEVLKRL